MKKEEWEKIVDELAPFLVGLSEIVQRKNLNPLDIYVERDGYIAATIADEGKYHSAVTLNSKRPLETRYDDSI